MYYLELTWLLQALLLTLVVMSILLAMRALRRRGQVVLLTLVAVCAVSNPGRGRHVRAILREIPNMDEHRLRDSAEYHDFLIVSATTVRGRLRSVGWLGRLFVASIPCTPSGRSGLSAPREGWAGRVPPGHKPHHRGIFSVATHSRAVPPRQRERHVRVTSF